MDSANKHRRPRKIRRTGRHTTPSQVEKVAEKAGKAAPAMAIAGVIVAAPQAHAAVPAPAKAGMVAERVHTGALVRYARPASRTYTVRSGDTLSSIAQHFYDKAADWPWLYHVNEVKVANPNLIYPGQKLQVPYDPPANAASYAPRHAKAATLTSSNTDTSASSSTSAPASSNTDASASSNTSAPASSDAQLSGTLGCSGLEALWEAAGGSPSEAFIAAEIAMAESGGDQYALSPTNDYGYWQINGSHGPALATFDAMGNARAAIIISDDGTDWDPWTTYVTGAYEGQC
jgi:LysM repeat protein